MSQLSISQRLHSDLARLIANTQPGERLLAEPKLAHQLGVSRATLREAMRTFETQGMIRRKQGSGTYVTHPSGYIESGLEILESIETIAERTGLPVSMGRLEINNRPASKEEAEALNITTAENVLVVTRVINADGCPAAYLTDVLPNDILQPEDLGEGFTGSVLDLLIKRGSPKLHNTLTEIKAVAASSEVAKALEIQRGDVLMHFISSLYTDDRQVADYSSSYFLPGYFRFHINRRIT
jgi:GntR family transcriptional regulator